MNFGQEFRWYGVSWVINPSPWTVIVFLPEDELMHISCCYCGNCLFWLFLMVHWNTSVTKYLSHWVLICIGPVNVWDLLHVKDCVWLCSVYLFFLSCCINIIVMNQMQPDFCMNRGDNDSSWRHFKFCEIESDHIQILTDFPWADWLYFSVWQYLFLSSKI